MSFRQIAMENRYKLLLSLIYLNKEKGGGSASTGYEIGHNAKRMGLIESPKEIKGATLDSWIKTKKIPAWAIRSASNLLLKEEGYQPRDGTELSSLLLMLVEGARIESAEELKALVNERIEVDDSMIEQALLAKNRGA